MQPDLVGLSGIRLITGREKVLVPTAEPVYRLRQNNHSAGLADRTQAGEEW
jgi:hypothetical protein